jgi:hypothetical protein
MLFDNCTFGVSSGVKTAFSSADIGTDGNGNLQKVRFVNCLLASPTPYATWTHGYLGMPGSAGGLMLSFDNYNQVPGDYRIVTADGTITRDVAISRSGGTSLRLTPKTTYYKFKSIDIDDRGFAVPVSSGRTVTPSVYVYESATYNGSRARLVVKRNIPLGITSDTVLDTRTGAADAVWELMTGTTAAVTQDGVLEFYVDCDGTAGYVCVDSFTAV